MRAAHGDLSRIVGELLSERMGAHGYTQTQVARMAGMSQPTLSRCLSGNTTWDLDDLAAVCRILGTRASDVIAVAEDTLSDANGT